jgi:hypothetical protein
MNNYEETCRLVAARCLARYYVEIHWQGDWEDGAEIKLPIPAPGIAKFLLLATAETVNYWAGDTDTCMKILSDYLKTCEQQGATAVAGAITALHAARESFPGGWWEEYFHAGWPKEDYIYGLDDWVEQGLTTHLLNLL